MPRLAAVCILGFAATTWAQGAPLDYPQWRGQARDGSASGFAEPASWPAALTRRRKVEVGEGYATPLVVGDTVYVVVGDVLFGLSQRASGQFFALDAKTGTTLWLGPPREATNTAVVKARDLLFLLNDHAELIVARSSRAGLEPIRRYTVADSATWAQPAISGNRVFVKDVTSLTLWTVN